MTKWERFKRWLFPSYFKWCGTLRYKTQKFKDRNGEFCDEEEATEYWFDWQIWRDIT